MSDRRRWQYCQIEVNNNSTGILKQFVADREPITHDLYGNWVGMIGKLGEQGWELVSTLSNGKNLVTYVFKRAI